MKRFGWPIYLLFIALTIPAISFPQANDCSQAIKICGDGRIATNASGAGTQEISNLNSCGSQENNSLWLEVEIKKSGTLGFDLIPDSSDLLIDYDFFIFGPNVDCGDLGDAIRCSTTNPRAAGTVTNHTGMNDSETNTSEGPGDDGNAYVKSLDVQSGETYFIVIDRPHGDGAFTLEWSGSATINGSPFPEGPITSSPANLHKCNSNFEADFDILSTASQITDQNNTTLSYHESLAEANDDVNPVSETYRSTQPSKTIYARVENDLTGCYKIVEFDLIIDPGPDIKEFVTLEKCDLDNSGVELFDLENASSEILNGLGNSFELNYFSNLEDALNNINEIQTDYSSEGNESVFLRVSEIGNPDCYNIAEIELILNAPPQVTAYEVVQPQVSSNFNTLTLNIPENLDYEYSIGNVDGPYQTGTTFTDVESGFQTLYIRDKKGCAIIETEIAILGYDNYFTPNNDGIHDKWQIKGIEKAAGSQNNVSIFDRYGKLLKNMDVLSNGWDGTFNGKPLPADDYWFRVTLKNGQEFNGHFSLKR